MTFEESYVAVKNFYKTLMKNGQSLNDIDNMDIHFFWELFAEETGVKSQEKIILFADDVPWL